MSMNELKKSVEEMASDEYKRASAKHGVLHASIAEAYAVMLEELEETQEEVIAAERWLKNTFWLGVRENDPDFAAVAAQNIKEHAILTACEAIQLAAMAEKSINTGRFQMDIPDERVVSACFEELRSKGWFEKMKNEMTRNTEVKKEDESHE